MAKQFYESQQLSSVTGPWIESEGTCTFHMVGRNGCTAITVTMEPGLYSAVPWAVAEYTDKTAEHVNLLCMEEVREAPQCES